jgi:hypothetical protein
MPLQRPSFPRAASAAQRTHAQHPGTLPYGVRYLSRRCRGKQRSRFPRFTTDVAAVVQSAVPGPVRAGPRGLHCRLEKWVFFRLQVGGHNLDFGAVGWLHVRRQDHYALLHCSRATHNAFICRTRPKCKNSLAAASHARRSGSNPFQVRHHGLPGLSGVGQEGPDDGQGVFRGQAQRRRHGLFELSGLGQAVFFCRGLSLEQARRVR